MPLRLAVVTVLSTITLILLGAPAGAHVELDPGGAQAGSTVVADPSATSTTTSTTEPTATTSTGSDLPGTTLEAQERDDGNTSAAPWLIGSGIAALAAIGIGGTLLKRRMG